jgi:acyl-CoA ligase (AMP-forming) (exosortase A-associated)
MHLLHQLVSEQSKKIPQSIAISYKNDSFSYQEVNNNINLISQKLDDIGIEASQRVGIYLPKRIETVYSFFVVSQLGAIFVPINPILKAQQVQYILKDCNVRLLITSYERFQSIKNILPTCIDLEFIILIDKPKIMDNQERIELSNLTIYYLEDLLKQEFAHSSGEISRNLNRKKQIVRDSDIVAILYTSGSTGNPKGVMLSHRNLMIGAESVSLYLKNTHKDKILAVLPFSFDYGLNQLFSAFYVGASLVLMDYLFPQDILKAINKYQITGLAGVPSLWVQLTKLDWDKTCTNKKSLRYNSLRYISNSGGALPLETLNKLREVLPNIKPYLMYGLTEAFRSTYVPPEELDNHKESIGIAIPNAQVLVLRPDGSECNDNEPGELVHLGELIAQGYWDDPIKTAKTFRPYTHPNGKNYPQISVYSGDTVYRAKDGYLYFIGRKDDMIKTSGYRVSPSEVEDILYKSKLVQDVIAIGIQHPALGQAILVLATLSSNLNSKSKVINEYKTEIKMISDYCKNNLANYMIPKKVIIRSSLALNQNGKIDRKLLANEYKDIFK